MEKQGLKIMKDGKPFLEGKVAFINGLSSDIGASIGRVLIQNGAKVAGTYNSNKDSISQLEKDYKGKVKGFQVDLLKDDYATRIKQTVKDATSWQGRIDILVNAAGIWMIKPFLYEEQEDMESIWRINYHGPVVYCQEVLKQMMNRSGDIINISSTTGVRGTGQLISYAATKAAMINFTMSIAEEFGPRNVKVNVISPGTTDTKAIDSHLDFVSKELLLKNIPRSRLCHPDDIAMAVLGVLMNDYMTGNNIILHGGKL